MIAYISRSVSRDEDLLVSTLVWKLGELKFGTTSTDYNIDDFTKWSRIGIKKSNILIGFISEMGKIPEKVIQEYSMALDVHTPVLVLIEDSISLPKGLNRKNVIIFNRENPQAAIDEINEKKHVYENNAVDTFAWLFGGEVLINVLEAMIKYELVS